MWKIYKGRVNTKFRGVVVSRQRVGVGRDRPGRRTEVPDCQCSGSWIGRWSHGGIKV